MIIKFVGEQTTEQMMENLTKVVSEVLVKVGIEGVPFKVKTVEMGLVFDVEGEQQFLTVAHEGVEEIFQINVQLDEEGEIKKSVNNEEQSFQDDFTRSVMKGEEFKVGEPIESEYNEADLIELDRVDGGDIVEVRSRHKETDEIIYQYFYNGELVGEMAVIEQPKTDEEA